MRMRVTSMDKKEFIIQHKMTKQQLSEMKLPMEEIQKLIQQGIWNKTIQLFMQTTKVKQREEADAIVWEYKMFMFGERDFWTMINEICEMNPEDLVKLNEDAKDMLGVQTNRILNEKEGE